MASKHEKVQDYAQRKMNEIKGLSVSDRYVIKIDSSKTDAKEKNILTKLDLEMIINNGGNVTRSRILQLIRSEHPEDRQYASELLLNSSSDENVSLLIELLNDPTSKVRITAIKASIVKHNNEVILSLIDNLNYPEYSNYAMNALIRIGNSSLNLLEGCFYRTGQSSQSLLKIIQIIGEIGGQRAKDVLWNKIDFPDKVIVSQIIKSLGESGFKASISQVSRIKYAIELDIADIRWNLSALIEVGEAERARDIIEAIEYENQSLIEHIYMLLAMLYDTNSIQLVKENIESGTTEGTTYAIELLDVFLSDQLKQRVIPVLDELTITEKISRLEVFYPRIRLDEKLVLKFLINRDFIQTNRWTKACVLKQIGEMSINDFLMDLIAQLFNPDRLIREIAAWSLYQIDPMEYSRNASRLNEDEKQGLDNVILPSKHSMLMLYEIINFYRRIDFFGGMQGIVLSYFADVTEELHVSEGQAFIVDEKENPCFYFNFKGTITHFESGVEKNKFYAGDFIGEILSQNLSLSKNTIVAAEPSILLRLNKDIFYELLSSNVVLMDKVLELK
jgi:HEAT repeat protein